MIKVIICDDQALIRDGLSLLIKLEKSIELLSTASNGQEALEQVEKFNPDILLIDLNMPVMNGVETIRIIKSKYPEVKTLVLTTYDDDDWLFDAIEAGASGYLLKDTPREDLIKAIMGTANGASYIDPEVAGKIMGQISYGSKAPSSIIKDKLTPREIDVLHCLAQGLNNNRIAEKLFISEGTVRNHISIIFSKLEVSDRTEAAVLAIKHGFGH